MKNSKRQKRRRPRAGPKQKLKLSPDVWAKLLYLRDRGPTEIGGFGISPRQDLLYLMEFQLIRQRSTWSSVAFDDVAIADYFDEQVDRGLVPEQFARIWVHTHPGDCPLPSGTDEKTFQRCFGSADWSVMFILAKRDHVYARLRFTAGPGGEIEIPVEVEYSGEFPGSNVTAWNDEYLACVNPGGFSPQSPEPRQHLDDVWDDVPLWDVDGVEFLDLEEELVEPPF